MVSPSGPLSLFHRIESTPPGSPSSLAVPSSWTGPGRTGSLSGPALTSGDWLALSTATLTPAPRTPPVAVANPVRETVCAVKAGRGNVVDRPVRVQAERSAARRFRFENPQCVSVPGPLLRGGLHVGP